MSEPSAPTEQQILRAAASLSRWAPLLRIARIVPGRVRRLTLTSQLERRTIREGFTEPAHPLVGRSELYRDEAGAVHHARPALGRTGEDRFAVRGTVVVETCVRCGGKKRKICHHCHGTGKTSCSRCGGSGTVRTGSRDSRKKCPNCRQGKTACSPCGGVAHRRCGVCDDQLKTRTYTCVDFSWSVARRDEIDNPLDVPMDEASALLADPVELDLDDPAGQSLRATADARPEEGLLFRALHEQAAPVVRVDATLFGRPQVLWLLGEERRPLAPELVRWSAVIDRVLVIATVVLVLAAAALRLCWGR